MQFYLSFLDTDDETCGLETFGFSFLDVNKHMERKERKCFILPFWLCVLSLD